MNKDYFQFFIEKRLQKPDGGDCLARAGTYTTPHGDIQTPAFCVVGTKATVKGLTPEMVQDLNAQVFLANTYHLYLAPGERIVRDMGGLHEFSRWSGPMITDSGGFQAFSLGAAFGNNVSKIATDTDNIQTEKNPVKESWAKITEDGVEFKSHRDGSKHLFTPEKSMQIQRDLGADIYFAFDECTSPQASYEYQREAMDRTHRWAQRSLDEHQRLEREKIDSEENPQALWGVVQGGRYADLRREAAETMGAMDFAGYGIGGSFDKHDMDAAVGIVCKHLPEEKPRHLLGIGEVEDLFLGVENGIDTFDCVSPTRMARHGSVHTRDGKTSLLKKMYRTQTGPIDAECGCYTCSNYSVGYVAHLLREKEMLGATLASIHNVYFIVNLVHDIRQSLLDDTFWDLKSRYLARYYKQQGRYQTGRKKVIDRFTALWKS